jgi:hypothetical protein
MATLEEVERALHNAHNAGDTEAATHLAGVYKQMRGDVTPTTKTPWLDVAMSAGENLIPSTIKAGADVANTVIHPLDTWNNLRSAARGGLANLFNSKNPALQKDRELASGIANFYKDRYGSEEGFKKSLSNDPAGVLMDVSSVAGGLGALGKGTKLGELATKISRVEPISSTINDTASLAKLVGKGAAKIVGEIGTNTGGESLIQAARSGAEGGAASRDFLQSMRNKTKMSDVVDEAQTALTNMRKERGAAYRADMAITNADPTILNFNPIKQALNDTLTIGTYKGKTLDPEAVAVQQKLSDMIKGWGSENPADFHTVEGLDALKRGIGVIKDRTPFGSPDRVIANKVYNAVRGQIDSQAPQYAKTMRDYAEASDLTKEIERSLSLGENASADTSIRKLQSITRNNVNTNYGNRVTMAKQLQEAGAPNLMGKLAGQSLNSIAPRGLGKVIVGGEIGASLMASNPAILPLLALQSPRLMGELAHATGKIAGLGIKSSNELTKLAAKIGMTPKSLANALYQANQPKQVAQ